MNRRGGVRAVVIAGYLMLAGGMAGAAAQPSFRAQQADVPPGGLSAVELQRWLDAYVSMQAQDALVLTDAQFPQFLGRLRALQTVRRKHLQARNQILQQLARLTGPRAQEVNETNLRERLEALDAIEMQAVRELRQAYGAIDQVLDVRQRARFRVFEDQMERRKLDLLARARRGAAMRRAPVK